MHGPKALYVLSETDPRIWLGMRSSPSLRALSTPIGLNGTSTHTCAHGQGHSGLGSPLSPELCCRGELFSAYWWFFLVDLKSALWIDVPLALAEPQIYGLGCLSLSFQAGLPGDPGPTTLPWLFSWSLLGHAWWDHDCQLWRGLGPGFLFFCERNDLNQTPLSLGPPDHGAISDLIRG